MINVYRAQAESALKQREVLVTEARSIHSNKSMTDAQKRSRLDNVNAEIEALTVEARSAVEQGERETSARNLSGSFRSLVSPVTHVDESDQWRSILPSAAEFRLFQSDTNADGGFAAPKNTADKVVSQVLKQSVFLGSPGVNVIPFEGASFTLPQITANTAPVVTAEGALIADGKSTFAGLVFSPIKYADLRWASNELLADSAAPMRDILGNEMVRTVGTAIDADAFGTGLGVTALKGLCAAGMSTNTTLAAGNVAITWDNIIGAYVDVLSTGAVPSVIWVSADMYKGLLQQKASSAGTYLAGDISNDPASAALGLPIRVSANLPVKTAIVAAGDRIFVGVRQDVSVKVSEDARFEYDQVGYRLTTRVAGLVVAEAGSVQRITAATI